VLNDLPEAKAALSKIPLLIIYANPDSTVFKEVSSGIEFIINANLSLSFDL